MSAAAPGAVEPPVTLRHLPDSAPTRVVFSEAAELNVRISALPAGTVTVTVSPPTSKPSGFGAAQRAVGLDGLPAEGDAAGGGQAAARAEVHLARPAVGGAEVELHGGRPRGRGVVHVVEDHGHGAVGVLDGVGPHVRPRPDCSG